MDLSSGCSPLNPSTSYPATSDGGTRTGLVFESGLHHFDRHNKFHAERPCRIKKVEEYLKRVKKSDGERALADRCHLLESRSGCFEDLGQDGGDGDSEELGDYDYLRVHLPGYLKLLEKVSKCKCHDRLDIEAEQFKSIYFTSNTFREAKAAASSLCRLVSRVASGKLDNGFAVIRPPGHHAEPGGAGGYCIINNVAVAAKYAQEKLGMKKILIVDWDVHHGNGTQKAFINNPSVLCFSVHRHHGGNYYPFMQHGSSKCVGIGAGEGFNINVGWSENNMGDDEYFVVWEKLLMPVAEEFNPDFILVSAGFDAARGDVGECSVTPECFARLTRRLKMLADGKVVLSLEGGYVKSVLCESIESVMESLLDANSTDRCRNELETFYNNLGDNDMLDCICPSAARSIRDTIEVHSKYWKCLKSEE